MAQRKRTMTHEESCHRSSPLRTNVEHYVLDSKGVFASSSSSDEEVAAACRAGRRNSSPSSDSSSDRFARNRVDTNEQQTIG